MRKRNMKIGALALTVFITAASPASSASPAPSPVADAAMRGEIETVRSLLREGADVNAAEADGAATQKTFDVLIPITIRYIGDNEDGKRSVPT